MAKQSGPTVEIVASLLDPYLHGPEVKGQEEEDDDEAGDETLAEPVAE